MIAEMMLLVQKDNHLQRENILSQKSHHNNRPDIFKV